MIYALHYSVLTHNSDKCYSVQGTLIGKCRQYEALYHASGVIAHLEDVGAKCYLSGEA